MKAYVVKRSDGKYLENTLWFITDKLTDAWLFEDKKDAENYCKKREAKVVVVEIKEIEE